MMVKMLSNKKSVTVLIAVLLLLSAGVAAYSTLAGKPARSMYLEAEGKNIQKYSEQIKQAYKEFYEYQKPYMEEKYRSRTELTAGIKSGDPNPFGLKNAGDIFDIVGKCKLIVDAYQNPVSEESLTKLSLLMQSAPLIDASVFTRKGQLGFTVPVLLPDKYFTLDLNNLDRVYDKLFTRYGIPPVKPKRIFRAVDVAKTVKFSNQELDGLIKDYGSLVSATIDDKDVRYGNKVTVKVGEEEKKGREVRLTLDGTKTKILLQKLAEKIADDDVLLRMTYENYADVIGLLDEAGLFQLAKVLESEGVMKKNNPMNQAISRVYIKKDMTHFKDAVKTLGERFSYPDGIHMTVVIDSSGNILDRRINLTCMGADSGKSEIELHMGTNDLSRDNFKNGFCTAGIKYTDSKGDIYIREFNINSNIASTGKDENEKGLVEISFSGKKGDARQFDLQARLDIDRSTDELTLKKNSTIGYDIQLKDPESGSADAFKGSIQTARWKNDKYKTRNTTRSISMDINSSSLGLKNTGVKLETRREDKFDVDFSLPAVQEANKVKLDNITDEELEKLEKEIENSFGAFYINNKPLMDTLLGGGS